MSVESCIINFKTCLCGENGIILNYRCINDLFMEKTVAWNFGKNLKKYL